ncbi:MAG: lipid A export permease/ATP-binding protein MsbA [Pseudomonadota bacterium]|nr:lipid A export permease/ATP-binding protein MsbA [Pseudomonadota bacterium]
MSSRDQTNSGAAIYRRLLGYSMADWPIFAVAIVGMVLFAVAETGFAWMMKPLLDGSFVERDPAVIRAMPFVLIGLFLLRGVAAVASGYGMAVVGQNVIHTMRSELFSHMLRLPASFFDRNPSGQLLSQLTFNVDQVSQAATQAVTVLIRDTLKVIGFIGLMFYLNPLLSGFALLVGPLIALLIRFVSRRFRRISTRIQNSMGELTHTSEEMIDGQRIVKIFGTQDYEQGRFEKVNEHNRRLNLKRSLTQQASNPTVQLIAAIPIAGIVYVATSENVLGTMSPGSFAAFLGAMIGLLNPLRQLTTVNAQLQRGIAAAESIFDLLGTEPEADVGTRRLPRSQGHIQFAGVRFRYKAEHRPVLDGIDLEVKPGQTVALVGRSGSGKTTLVSLLPRFYDVDQGRVLLDGQDVREYRLADLRSQISVVSQEVVLFNDTVAANIAYGVVGEITEQRLEDAARAAHAWEFIQALPQGLSTPIGQHGTLLSGGQRQRLAIARALLKDAPILILDEATSALDSESERHIQAALEELMRERTTLVIAHRLSTVERADQIIVMHNGRIVEQGTHAELLAQGGHYAELHRLQFRESETA